MRWFLAMLAMLALAGCGGAVGAALPAISPAATPDAMVAARSPTPTPPPDHVVAPELRPLETPPFKTMTLDAARKQYCPQSVDWSDVDRSPALYRERCAWLLGDVRVQDFHSRYYLLTPDLAWQSVANYPALGGVQVMLDMSRYGGGGQWQGAPHTPFVEALGTVQGRAEGYLYMYVEEIWTFPY